MDKRLRDIERRIAEGDASAWPDLFRSWRRAGRCDVESLGPHNPVTTAIREMVKRCLDESNISHPAFDGAKLDVRLESFVAEGSYNSNSFLAHVRRECKMRSEEPAGTPVDQIGYAELGHLPQLGPRLRSHLMAEEGVLAAFRQNENTGARWFRFETAGTQWGAMQPEIQHGQWVFGTGQDGYGFSLPLSAFNWNSPLVYDAVMSGETVDSDLIDDLATHHYPQAKTQLSAQEFAAQAREDFESGLEDRVIQEVEYIDGWGGRLTMPGYMDSTEWTIYDSEQEAIQYLLDAYEPELVGNLVLEFTLEIDCDYLLDLQQPFRRNPMTFGNRWRWGYNDAMHYRRNADIGYRGSTDIFKRRLHRIFGLKFS